MKESAVGESPHCAIGKLRGQSLGVLHVGFDDLKGETVEFSEKARGGGRGWASGVWVWWEVLLGRL